MNRLIAWFAENHVASNLLMLGIVFAGIVTVPTIRQTVFPDFDTKYVSATVVYPGSAPVDIEKAVTIRIEEEIQDLEGIEEISSSANEGATNVIIELIDSADTGKAVSEIETRIDGITTFPQEIEEPIVKEILFTPGVVDIIVYGQADEKTLKLIGQRVRDDLASLPEISQVTLSATRAYEVSIEVSQAALQQYGLRFDEVALAVRRSSLDLPGGNVKTDGGEILLRTDGQAYWREDFERIPLVVRDDGTRVNVGDVARVVDGFEEAGRFASFDGQPAVYIELKRVGEQRVLDVARAAKAYVERERKNLPAGIHMALWDDDSAELETQIDMMLRNATFGFVLVIGLLAVFLKLRVAIWVAFGIPIAIAGGLALMPHMGLGINILTVFSFIMALPSFSDPGEPEWLDEEAKLIGNMKKTMLAVTGLAAQKFGPGLKDQQGVLADAADICMEAYACESGLLRTLKRAEAGGQEAAGPMADMLTLYVHDAMDRVAVKARSILAAAMEGDELRTTLAGLRRLTKHDPVNRAALHDAIAARVIDADGYTVG